MLTEFLFVLYTAGTAPDYFTGGSGNSLVVMAALYTSQKAAQYTLGVVPSGFSSVGIFIDIATLILFSLYQEAVIEADNIANALLMGEQIVGTAYIHWVLPLDDGIP